MVYTGNGPENYSSSSPLGQAFRALGRGLRVCLIEFVHRKRDTDFLALEEAFDGRLVYHSAEVKPDDDSIPAAHQRKNAVRALQLARRAIESDEFDMVVLDRLTDLMTLGLVDSREVLVILSARPRGLHIIISGHSVPDELCRATDLVTVVESAKPNS